jgi:3-oxoadipate enol-lactonase
MPYVTAGASKLYYEEYGEGPAVVLLHGVGGNHASWFEQAPAFSRRYRTTIIDQRAFGNSTDVEELGRSAFVDDLATLLDALGLERVSLVAQSMGGGTSAAFTCRFPERVRALVLADSLAGAVLPEPHASELAKVNAATANLTQVERVLGPIVRENDPERTLLYLQIASFNSVTLKTVKGAIPKWSPAELAKAGTPVLYVVGEDDILFPPALIRAAHELTPGSRFAQIARAGHSAYFEAPAAFNEVVLGFLDDVHTSAA